jgi:ABC-type glycerol-3-phosphate transport system substrate-binding protein
MKRCFVALALMISLPGAAYAGCGIEGSGEVNILSNVYPALQVIRSVLEGCSTDTLHVSMKLTKANVAEITQAFAAKTSPFSAAQVANGSVVAPQSAGELRPLDDLVAKYRGPAQIEDQMLIRFGDHVTAIAFQVNTQYLYYRKDLFDKYGIAVPKTYEEMFLALDKLRTSAGMDHPLTGAYQTGWEVGEEFTNLFLAEGGRFFKPGSAEPDVASDKGIATLNLMKRLMAYMSPNALSIDSALAAQAMQQGSAAIGVIWQDSAVTMDDPKASIVVDKVGFAPAPAITPGGAAAATVWWDGFVIPTNAPADPDLAFQVFMKGISPQVVAEHNDTTVWIRSNYKPTRYAGPVLDTVKSGAPPYPSTPQQSLIHGAIGNHIGDFLAGKVSAMDALKAAEDSYRQAARDKGLL